MSNNEIKISSSAVLGMLAEPETRAELFEALGFKPHSNNASEIKNPFDYMLSRNNETSRKGR